MSGEVASTNAAVRDTANQVVTYDGQVAVTYFFSTSGGETENIENVWIGSQPAPYLRGVKDPYDRIAPRHSFIHTRFGVGYKLEPELKSDSGAAA